MSPKELALRRLTLREYSSAELLSYLRRKGVEEAPALEVIRELEESGLIDPKRYAAAIARSQISRGKGPVAVMAKLRRRGLNADLASARRLYEAETGGNPTESGEVQSVKHLLNTRYSGIDLTNEKSRLRVYRSLLRRGFSPSVVAHVMRIQDSLQIL